MLQGPGTDGVPNTELSNGSVLIIVLHRHFLSDQPFCQGRQIQP